MVRVVAAQRLDLEGPSQFQKCQGQSIHTGQPSKYNSLLSIFKHSVLEWSKNCAMVCDDILYLKLIAALEDLKGSYLHNFICIYFANAAGLQ